ncbi:MAG: hypothetical protein IIW39_04695, partial [Clostridia bacterium]|nr:hypothetical protein [Clostridia bacterium]
YASSPNCFLSPFKSLQKPKRKNTLIEDRARKGLMGLFSRFRALPKNSVFLTVLRSKTCGGRNSSPNCFASPFKSLQNRNRKGHLVVSFVSGAADGT